MANIVDKLLKRIRTAIPITKNTIKADNKFNYVDDNINTDNYNVVVYFNNGNVCKVIPEPQGSYYDSRDMIYHADAIISDGVLYNLSDMESIQSIIPPTFADSNSDISKELGVTGCLDYVLRMKAGQYYNERNVQLCSTCLWKCTELMFLNPNGGWSKEDYMRLVYWHYELGMLDEAEKAQKFITIKLHCQKDLNIFDKTAIQQFNSILSHGIDLVVVSDYGHGCCEKCAPFRGRVYSISGKNKNYPKLPDYVKSHGNFHNGCRCCLNPYFGGLIFFNGEQVDAIISSNRPFIDDRTQEEIDNYNKYLKLLEDKALEEETRLNNSILRGKNEKEFAYFRENYPEIAPKTIDGYIKGKRTNSKKFQQLMSLAEADGVTIDFTAI